MRTIGRGALRLGAAGSLLAIPLGVMAFPFQYSDVSGNLDTTVSLGASVRMEERSANLVGITNGGTSRSVNDDDGNLNYRNGAIISAAAKATHDLELRWQDWKFFTRASYFYDAKNEDNDFLGRRAKDRLGSGAQLLDLFIARSFDLGGNKLSLRAGKQVVNWGESTFIGNSINSINPIDVARIRTPGAELKEALIPTPILWGSMDITNSTSIEAFWLLDFKETRIDPRGSFFSTSDIASDDGDRAFVAFGRRDDQHGEQRLGRTARPNEAAPIGTTAPVWVPRSADRRVQDQTEQFGLALHYLAEEANNTEFGFYWMQYHNRTPLVSATRGASAALNTTNALTPAAAQRPCSATVTTLCTARYFIEYPEKVQLWGLSYNTTAPFGIALQGEYSYREDLPVQLAATEVLLAALRLPNAIDISEGRVSIAQVAVAPVDVQGYRRVTAHQVQTTGTKAFGPTGPAEQFVVVGEVGANYLALPSNQLFAGPGTALPSCQDGATSIGAAAGSCQEMVGGGYASKFSWGYRAVARMDFENVIGALQLSPRVVFAHDVRGVGPNFNQGTKAATVGLAFNYLQRWQADLGYTNFFDGRSYSGTDPIAPNPLTGQARTFSTGANPNSDRDFLAVSLSYAF